MTQHLKRGSVTKNHAFDVGMLAVLHFERVRIPSHRDVAERQCRPYCALGILVSQCLPVDVLSESLPDKGEQGHKTEVKPHDCDVVLYYECWTGETTRRTWFQAVTSLLGPWRGANGIRLRMLLW